MKGGLLLLAMALVTGCAHTYGTSRTYTDMPKPKLATDGNAYLALSKPGAIGKKIYPQSGMMTSEEIRKALTHYMPQVVVGGQPENYDTALASARRVKARYLILPEIQQWEDHPTEWTGQPDRIAVKIRVIDVTSGDLLDAVDISGISRWFTFGGDHPQDLLQKPVGAYIKSLFE